MDPGLIDIWASGLLIQALISDTMRAEGPVLLAFLG